MNQFGHNFRLAIWGESHGHQIGISLDGVPAGIPLSEEDFADIWLIGDYSGENGNGYIAIRLINALNTGGLQITTQNKAKGQFAFEFMGHYSIKNPEIVPYELYIKQEIGA